MELEVLKQSLASLDINPDEILQFLIHFYRFNVSPILLKHDY